MSESDVILRVPLADLAVARLFISPDEKRQNLHVVRVVRRRGGVHLFASNGHSMIRIAAPGRAACALSLDAVKLAAPIGLMRRHPRKAFLPYDAEVVGTREAGDQPAYLRCGCCNEVDPWVAGPSAPFASVWQRSVAEAPVAGGIQGGAVAIAPHLLALLSRTSELIGRLRRLAYPPAVLLTAQCKPHEAIRVRFACVAGIEVIVMPVFTDPAELAAA